MIPEKYSLTCEPGAEGWLQSHCLQGLLGTARAREGLSTRRRIHFRKEDRRGAAEDLNASLTLTRIGVYSVNSKVREFRIFVRVSIYYLLDYTNTPGTRQQIAGFSIRDDSLTFVRSPVLVRDW